MGVSFESPDDVCQLKWTVFKSCHFLAYAELYQIIETVPLFFSRPCCQWVRLSSPAPVALPAGLGQPPLGKMFLVVAAALAGDGHYVGAMAVLAAAGYFLQCCSFRLMRV